MWLKNLTLCIFTCGFWYFLGGLTASMNHWSDHQISWANRDSGTFSFHRAKRKAPTLIRAALAVGVPLTCGTAWAPLYHCFLFSFIQNFACGHLRVRLNAEMDILSALSSSHLVADLFTLGFYSRLGYGTGEIDSYLDSQLEWAAPWVMT